MDRALRALLVAALDDPNNTRPQRAVADWLSEHHDPRADLVHQHCRTGSIHFPAPRWLSLGEDCVGRPGPVYLALLLLPHRVAVEFVAGCAERVLPAFHRERPDDRRPGELLAAVRGWLRGEVTKKRLRGLLEAMRDLWGEDAAPSGAWEWPSERSARWGMAVHAGESAIRTALTAASPPSSGKWVEWACLAVADALGAADDPVGERESQRQDMLRLLRDMGG